jgi:hypothetical protein
MGMIQTESTAMVALAAMAMAAAPACERCGAPIVRRRRRGRQSETLCLACDQRDRRAAYFQRYYAAHKDRILAKNRRWAKDNKEKLVVLRQTRQARELKAADEPRRCIDCGSIVVRAERCRRCYIRHRYAADPQYRLRRLATTRRWLDRRSVARQTPATASITTPITAG